MSILFDQNFILIIYIYINNRKTAI